MGSMSGDGLGSPRGPAGGSDPGSIPYHQAGSSGLGVRLHECGRCATRFGYADSSACRVCGV